jgi:hypothetical protein
MKPFLKTYAHYLPLLAVLTFAAPFSETIIHQQGLNGQDTTIHQAINGFQVIGYGFQDFSLHTLPFLIIVFIVLVQVIVGILKRNKTVLYIAIILFTITVIPLVSNLIKAVSWKSLKPFEGVQWGVPLFVAVQLLIILYIERPKQERS